MYKSKRDALYQKRHTKIASLCRFSIKRSTYIIYMLRGNARESGEGYAYSDTFACRLMPKYIDYIVKMDDLSIDGFCKNTNLNSFIMAGLRRILTRSGRAIAAGIRNLDFGNLMGNEPQPKITYILKKDGMADVRTEKLGLVRSLMRTGYSCSPPPPQPQPKFKEGIAED